MDACFNNQFIHVGITETSILLYVDCLEMTTFKSAMCEYVYM
jgi:hypothetical protein